MNMLAATAHIVYISQPIRFFLGLVTSTVNYSTEGSC